MTGADTSLGTRERMYEGWDNYGYYGWHIDHIRPPSWFNIQSINEPSFKECWVLSNLDPKWAEDNFKKNNLFEG